MQKSKIEWTDYTINPVKGLCPMACPYCYARWMYKRFKWDETIRFAPAVFNDIPKIKAGSRVFVGSTIELFGNWVDPAWMMLMLERVKAHPELTFIFLTKQPQNLINFSPFPVNCWVGVSVTETPMYIYAMDCLDDICAEVKFISFEPLLDWRIDPVILAEDFTNQQLDWVIIGAQTPYSVKTAPKIEWVKEIVESADKANIPVFLKPNLNPLFKLGSIGYDMDIFWHISEDGKTRSLRQEYPVEGV
jgi:protein gp37